MARKVDGEVRKKGSREMQRLRSIHPSHEVGEGNRVLRYDSQRDCADETRAEVGLVLSQFMFRVSTFCTGTLQQSDECTTPYEDLITCKNSTHIHSTPSSILLSIFPVFFSALLHLPFHFQDVQVASSLTSIWVLYSACSLYDLPCRLTNILVVLPFKPLRLSSRGMSHIRCSQLNACPGHHAFRANVNHHVTWAMCILAAVPITV